jgi:hypothetical protein
MNEPARSRAAPDVAPIGSSGDVLYETSEKDSLAVSYNLQSLSSNNFSGYRLTLIFRNSSGQTKAIAPSVTLKDASGLLLPSASYQGFMLYAARIADAPLPSVPASNNYRQEGTIYSSSGETYRYSGTSTSGSNFSDGFARGVAIRAALDQKQAKLMLGWAADHWLQPSYTVPPRSAVAGVLFFPSRNATPALPLTLVVGLGEKEFEFQTARE